MGKVIAFYNESCLAFQLVSFILIGVAAYARVVAVVTSLALVGGVIACGVFLFFTALIGLIGACKHHQVLLFFVSFKGSEHFYAPPSSNQRSRAYCFCPVCFSVC